MLPHQHFYRFADFWQREKLFFFFRNPSGNLFRPQILQGYLLYLPFKMAPLLGYSKPPNQHLTLNQFTIIFHPPRRG